MDEVPRSWQVKRISYIAILKSGDSITSEQIKTEGDFPVYGGNGHRGYTDGFNHDGHYVLIGRQGALCGNINYGFGKFWASEHAIVVHLTAGVNFKWCGELLRAMDLNQYNVSAAQPGLAIANLTCLKVPFPSVEEQQKIADFLDHETAKIDTLIEKQQQLIKLLKEKRQAVISHAVTKGLNPDAQMRDSGIEWLGEVPEHWVVSRLSRVGKIGQGCAFAHAIQGQETGELPWFKCMDMNTLGNEESMNKAANYVDYDLAEKIGAPIFPAGTVIFPRVGAALLTNKRRILVEPSVVDDNIYTFIPLEAHHRFIYMFLQLIDMAVFCSPGLVPTITFGAINNIFFPKPPLLEQQEIVNHVDTQVVKMDGLIQKAEIAIELMQERRTALISAAVTGKIDVRNWQPPKPATNEPKQAAA